MPGTGINGAAVSPTAKIPGCPGTLKSGPTLILPARSCSALIHSAAGEATTPAAPTIDSESMRLSPRHTPARGRGADAGGPDDRFRIDALVSERDAVAVARRHHRSRHHLDAHVLERAFGIS